METQTINIASELEADQVAEELKDETVELTTVKESKGYIKKAGLTFKALGTEPADWVPAEIEGFMPMGRSGIHMPVYNFPKGYQPAQTKHTSHETIRGYRSCWLCGHKIKDEHIIIHHDKKLWMVVGNVCVKHFSIAKYVREEYKSHVHAQTMKEFDTLWDSIQKYHKDNRVTYKLWQALHKKKEHYNTTRKMKNFIKKWSNRDGWKEVIIYKHPFNPKEAD
jgi:hypothetical protein